MPLRREILAARDAESIRSIIERVYQGGFQPFVRPHMGTVDWSEFYYRLECYAMLTLGDAEDTPAMRHIRSIVEELRSANRSRNSRASS